MICARDKAARERRWREEYADFIAAYNEELAAEGLPLDEWRTFFEGALPQPPPGGMIPPGPPRF
jgi:hypothetical protein